MFDQQLLVSLLLVTAAAVCLVESGAMLSSASGLERARRHSAGLKTRSLAELVRNRRQPGWDWSPSSDYMDDDMMRAPYRDPYGGRRHRQSSRRMHAARARGPMLGGLSDEKPADEHIRKIMDEAMSALETSYPGGFRSMEPVSYRTQVVAGMNYFVKVKVTDNSGDIKYAHLRLYKPIKSSIEVNGIKTNVCKHSPLVYFEAT